MKPVTASKSASRIAHGSIPFASPFRRRPSRRPVEAETVVQGWPAVEEEVAAPAPPPPPRARPPLLWPWLLLLLVLIPIQIVRAHQEARVLEDKFGDEYRKYRQGTWF